MLQRLSSVSCAHRTPAGLPLSIPGIGELIDRAMQHAPHPTRHSTLFPSIHSGLQADAHVLGKLYTVAKRRRATASRPEP